MNDVIQYIESKQISDKASGKITLSSSMLKLNPGLRNGVIRVVGRLDDADLPQDIKNPIILPQCHLCDLIIRDSHWHNMHTSVNQIWSNLREKYWIINAMPSIKRIVSNCVPCRKALAQPSTQLMANLPKERTTPGGRPFRNIGVDVFGPIAVRQGRSNVKRYGLIISCMASRAVHLEMLYNLDASAFICALRRFQARRGKPEFINCDNGTNFKGADGILSDLTRLWNASELGNYYRQADIIFKYNPPQASHFGGHYERLIRSVRRMIVTTLKNHSITDESLQTFLCEAEAQLNGRPLADSYIDDPQSNEPLTPNHLLLLDPTKTLPLGTFNKKDCYSKQRFKQIQLLADSFWKRWTTEYLTSLQERQKWISVKNNIEQGDIVLLVDDKQPRGTWTIARVIETFPDKHGLVREVHIKTPTDTLRRPITKLCVLLRANQPEH